MIWIYISCFTLDKIQQARSLTKLINFVISFHIPTSAESKILITYM